jgi:hypothetical protein
MVAVRVARNLGECVFYGRGEGWAARGTHDTAHTLEQMPLRNVLDSDLENALYFALPLDSTHPMYRDVRPLQVHPIQPSHLGIWYSTRNVITHTHYDRSLNVLVQVVGRKRVWLYPPNFLPVYPATHIHYHQTHSEPDLRQSVSVLLSPGDGLFIPPYWYHR